jgi:heat shock protein HslJ
VASRAFAAGWLILALAVCGVAEETPPAAPSRALEGPVWRITELPGHDAGALASARPGLSVRFEAGRVEGFSGCNRFAGGYTIAGDRVSLGPLAGTMMACDDPEMRLEEAFRGALAGTLVYAIAEDRLTLSSGSGSRLVLREEPAPSLEGVRWEVTGYNNGRQAVVGPRLGTTLHLSFQDGAVVGSGGCNSFRAAYTRDAGRLRIGPATSTRKACPEEGVMEQEREFLAALEAATTWSIRDGLLDMHFADGARALTAQAKQPGSGSG